MSTTRLQFKEEPARGDPKVIPPLSTNSKPHLALRLPPRSASRSFFPKSRLNSHSSIAGLLPSAMHSLYTGRCKDLNLTPLSSQEDRFYHDCQKYFFKDRQVSLSNTNLGLFSCKAFSNMLASNDHFSHLDVSSNHIGNRGASLLVKGLMANLSIIHIDLSNNSITPEGAAILFKSLRGQQSVVSVDMHGNRIGEKGTEALGRLLASNKLISCLNLAKTSVDPRVLAQGLRGNTSIVSLDISENGISDIEELCIALESCRLFTLRLSNNKICLLYTSDAADE